MNPRTKGRRRPIVLTIAVVAALSASLAVAGAASATKVAGGTTTLTTKKSISKKLKKAGIKMKAEDGATKAGKAFTFPITVGDLLGPPYVQAGTASGVVEHSGGLKFTGKNAKGKKKSLSIGDFVATFSDASTFASTSGKSGTMLSLGAPASVSADGLTIGGVRGKVAKALRKGIEKKFDLDLKKKTFGTLDVAATKDPNVAVNAGGTTKITFAAAALGKLLPEGPVVIAPATLGPPAPATLTVPVTGGTLNTQTGLGEIQHDGGISLSGCLVGGNPVTLDDPSILITSTGVALNVFSSLTGGRVNIGNVVVNSQSISGNAVTITGVVSINATATAALNTACGTTFTAGEVLGNATSEFTLAG